MKKRILSVGQCSMDHASLSRTFTRNFDAEVVRADDARDAISLLSDGGFDLVLVNRIFDANGDSGIDLIRQLRAEESKRTIPVMLVSNHADVQAQAVAAGALPGFGKADLGQKPMLERVSTILGSKSESS
jgi:two-component system, chemotaxis family, chemotaxis protein CheY